MVRWLPYWLAQQERLSVSRGAMMVQENMWRIGSLQRKWIVYGTGKAIRYAFVIASSPGTDKRERCWRWGGRCGCATRARTVPLHKALQRLRCPGQVTGGGMAQGTGGRGCAGAGAGAGMTQSISTAAGRSIWVAANNRAQPPGRGGEQAPKTVGTGRCKAEQRGLFLLAPGSTAELPAWMRKIGRAHV